MTFAQTLSVMTQRLSSAGIPDAAFDAKQLLCARSGFDATAFLLHRGDDIPPALAAEAERCVTRRINGEPLQYILGEWTFLDTSFAVGPGVLIPRPETEALVLQCADLLRGRNAPVIYDLCAGSGCIGLSLKKLVPDAAVYLVEYADPALHYLQINAQRLGFREKVQILQGDVLLGAPAFPNLPQADLIVSNPPYIRACEIASLQREVQREPREALDGGEDGLDFYRCFAQSWTNQLKENGWFAFECGEGQSREIAALFEQKAFSVTAYNDFNGFDRYVFAAHGRKDQL